MALVDRGAARSRTGRGRSCGCPGCGATSIGTGVSDNERRPGLHGATAQKAPTQTEDKARTGNRSAKKQIFNEASHKLGYWRPTPKAEDARCGRSQALRSAGGHQAGRNHRRQQGRARTRRARRRLRRHRDEPAVHRAGHLHHPPSRRACDDGWRLRGRLADLLGPDDHRLNQVRGVHHARPQPWGRRHHGAGLPPPASQGHPRGDAGDPRHLRRRAVLRRRDHHARDLGPRLGSGPEGGRAAARSPRACRFRL